MGLVHLQYSSLNQSEMHIRLSCPRQEIWVKKLGPPRFEGSEGRTVSVSQLQLAVFEDVLRMSRTKASFSQLQVAVLEGSLAQNVFLRDSRCAKSHGCQNKTEISHKNVFLNVFER